MKRLWSGCEAAVKRLSSGCETDFMNYAFLDVVCVVYWLLYSSLSSNFWAEKLWLCRHLTSYFLIIFRIKYEESREEGAERWGKAHVSSLSFHSLLNLRLHFERGVILLDFETKDFTSLKFAIVEEFCAAGLLNEDLKSEVLSILLYKHRYVEGEKSDRLGGLRRNLSGFVS